MLVHVHQTPNLIYRPLSLLTKEIEFSGTRWLEIRLGLHRVILFRKERA